MEQRLCVGCSKPLSSMRGAAATYCSSLCRAVAAKVKRDAEKPKVIPTGWLVHSCFSPDLNEPLPARCTCKKRLNDEQMRAKLANAGIVEIFGHPGEFGYTGRRRMVPRTPTIEKSHVEYAVVTEKPKEHRLSQAQIDELLRIRQEERLSFEQEARCRWEIYAQLTREAWQAITVEVPEIHDVWEGRAIFASGIGNDDRSSVGVDRSPLDSDAFEPDVFEQEEQPEGEVIEHDESTISLYQEVTEEFEYAESD